MIRASSRTIVAVLAFTCASIAGARAQSPPRSEYEIKAAYLFTFGRFVEWPPRSERADTPFTVCVLGADPFGPVLDTTIAEDTVRGRKVVAKRIADPADADGCHILFISASETRRLAAIENALMGARVLTVSDIPSFASRGGMIEFVTAGNRIRFQINLASTRAAGLTMSSELLKVATAVRTTGAAGDQ